MYRGQVTWEPLKIAPGIWGLCFLLMAQIAGAANSTLDWAYHDDDDEIDDRHVEYVPGESFRFLSSTNETVRNDEPVTLFVLLPHLADNDKDNVLDLRWWNGKDTNWISAVWQKDIPLGKETRAGLFHGLPMRGERTVDLWRVDVPQQVTRPGENYYFFRYCVKNNGPDENLHYIVRSDPYHDNNIGQSWSPVSETYGRDWKIVVLP